jgi:hypothetical protein
MKNIPCHGSDIAQAEFSISGKFEFGASNLLSKSVANDGGPVAPAAAIRS